MGQVGRPSQVVGDDRQRTDRSAELQDVVEDAVGSAAVEAYMTGHSQSSNDLTEVENADVERAESIGIPIAPALSFCYLLLVFRSLPIPVKAVLMNLLATFAAFGLTAWVFADSHLETVFGFALAVAVVLDATLIRLLIVPDVMKVAGGKANWWLPGFHLRILPKVNVE
jgi:putative drug exporter of the RND superfamily